MIKAFLLMIGIFFVSASAQTSTIEKTFEKSKRNYLVTKFSVGEDASSGSDYLVYRQKTSTRKIRVIWSNYEKVTVADYFYEAGKPVLLIKFAARKSQYKLLKSGANIGLKANEKFYFTEGKLTSWIENGKAIQVTDSRWAEKEKEVLARFEDELETFRTHLRGEL